MNLQDYRVGTPLEEFEKKIRNLNPRTQHLYRRCLNEFCNKFGITPNELYEYARTWETSDERGDRGRLSQMVSDFIREKIGGGLNPNTTRSYKKAINKFLSANELRLLKLENQKKIDSKGKPMATPEHIRELFDLSSTNVRMRALLTVLKDTGLRVSDVEQLTVEDFRNSKLTHDEYGREFRVWAEPITSKKTGVNAYVHLGYESIPWVEAYIGNRREGPIFLTKSGKKPMKSHSITTAIKNLCKSLNSRGVRVSAHSLRKFFLTTFDTNQASNTGKRIAGKRLSPTDAPYYATGENITNDYIRVYNAERGLAIFEKGQIAKTQERIKKLETDLETERAKTQKLSERVEDLETMLEDRHADLKMERSKTGEARIRAINAENRISSILRDPQLSRLYFEKLWEQAEKEGRTFKMPDEYVPILEYLAKALELAKKLEEKKRVD